MKNDSLKFTVFLVLLLTLFMSLFNSAMAANIRVLNHNFESDIAPLPPNGTTSISGWYSSGEGGVGIMIPQGNEVQYNGIVGQGQVAYLDAGARMSQLLNTVLEYGETYTLSFDVGKRLDQTGRNLVARVKSNGLILAYAHSDGFSDTAGEWSTESFTFTATEDMPIGSSLAVEFTNLATDIGYQVNIDNVVLSDTGTGRMLSITNDTELLVPDVFPDIPAALSYLDDKQIHAGKIVTIKVTDCSHKTYTSPIEIKHPDGQFIHIVGDANNPNQCVLQFNNSNGFTISDGYRLGNIDGFTIRGNKYGGSSAIKIENNGFINAGDKLLLNNFQYGVHAFFNSSVNVESVSINSNDSYGITVYYGSYANASYSEALSNGGGYSSSYGSLVNNQGSVLNNLNYGYYVLYNSTLLANDTYAGSHKYSGYLAKYKSSTNLSNAASYNNSWYSSSRYSAVHTDVKSYQDATNLNLSHGYRTYSPSTNQIGNEHSLTRR